MSQGTLDWVNNNQADLGPGLATGISAGVDFLN